MWQARIKKDLKTAVTDLGFLSHDIVVSISENSKFGDYTSNVALQLSKQKSNNSYQSPHEIASAILKNFGFPRYLERVEVAGIGFLNFFLKSDALLQLLSDKTQKESKKMGERILIEYAQPNTHKEFHIGHLRNITIGESLARLLEYQGHKIFRANYGSDIGLPVAKALWGVIHLKDEYEEIKKAPLKEKAQFLQKAYILGHKSYEDDPEKKIEIDQLNKLVYAKDPSVMPVWEETRKWSLTYFDIIYSRLMTEFDRVITESEVYETGKKIVEKNIGKVFIKDQGTVIFPGQKYDLHNRVFITSEGNPTYEAKEIGLTLKEQELFPYDKSLHVIDSQQSDFFRVVNKALEVLDSSFKDKKHHISYGFVSLTTGRMSSRMGTVVTAEDLIDQVKLELKSNFENPKIKSNDLILDKIAVGAVKFSFLKYALNSDIIFDIKQSVSIHGDSGPYLMYVYARIISLLNRAKEFELSKTHVEPIVKKIAQTESSNQRFVPEEKEVLRQLEYFQTVSFDAAQKYAPNVLCEYLLNLAKAYNLFYERYPVLHSKEEYFRLRLSKKVGETIKLGLYLLGIETVERM